MLQSIEANCMFLKVYIQRGRGELHWANGGDGQLQQVGGGRQDGAHRHHRPRRAQRLEHAGDGDGGNELLGLLVLHWPAMYPNQADMADFR